MGPFRLLCVTSLPAAQLELITQAFTIARERDPELTLEISELSCGSETFQNADLLVCLGSDPASEQAITRAQSLGLPVLAVEGGVAARLIESGRSGFILSPGAIQLADAIRWLARREPVRERLRTGGLLAAGARFAQPA